MAKDSFFVQVARTGDFKDGTMKEVKTGEHEILIARVKGKFYAADNICPHMGGKLGQGKLEGTIVTCPRHHSQFDLSDGKVIRWTDWTGIVGSVSKIFRSPRPLQTYPVKVEKDAILVDI
jgi:3-phenylpropionate/trans-cinnamate dioxygenase ferredoxin component